MNRHITLQTPHGTLHGHLDRPDLTCGLVLIARPHNGPLDASQTAEFLNRGHAVLGMELLTAQEIQFADATQNVPRLTQRLIDILDLIRNDGDMQELPLGIFVHGDMTPAAVRASALRDAQVTALACHGGLIDRAGKQALDLLVAPLLMLFDPDDTVGMTAYRRAAQHLACKNDFQALSQGESPIGLVSQWFTEFFASQIR